MVGDKNERKMALIKILEEEFDIHSEVELDAAIAALPGIDMAPFCAPVNSGASAGQSTDSPTDHPMEGHRENPRKIRL